jgi:hypothetical protein
MFKLWGLKVCILLIQKQAGLWMSNHTTIKDVQGEQAHNITKTFTTVHVPRYALRHVYGRNMLHKM